MRIIRFQSSDGRVLHGLDRGDGAATILEGSLAAGFRVSAKSVQIKSILAPFEPTEIICIGRNYHAGDPDAASDTSHPRAAQPDETLEVFLKPYTALQHPNQPIVLPRFDNLDVQLDCEGELAVVINRDVRHVSESEALEYVFGYSIANDVTARAFQTPTGPPLWMRGKGFDTFCPLGPAIITRDQIPDPQKLAIETRIDGRVVRRGNTSQMIRSVSQIISALSRHMTVRAGSVILTGAPPPSQPTESLKSGSVAEVAIQGIGTLTNTVATTKSG